MDKIYLEILEYIVIGILVFLQIYISVLLYKKIKEYKDIFNKEDLPEISKKYITEEIYNKGDIDEILSFEGEGLSTTVEITYLQNKSKGKVLPAIVKYLNIYLIKNKGAAIDFHIIKDIVEKHTETIETQIENRVPAPLYLGLAATMIGIIIGLFNVDFGAGSEALDTIKPLINGVKTAMFASVLGLIITTVFSIKIYKDAQTEVDEEKNEFLSKLQAELMPRMAKGKLPEVSVLSGKLDSFARTTNTTVSKLDEIVDSSRDNILKEQELINEIRNLDIRRLTSSNVRVFNQLGDMMDSFKQFAEYYDTLNRSLSNTTQLLSNLEEFVQNTKNVNSVLEEIKNNIKTSNSATEFFNEHIRSFQQYGESVRIAIGENDAAFRTALEQLTSATQTQYESFTTLISEFDSKLTAAFTHSVERFTAAMDEQVIRTEEAFERSRPKFEKLDKLNKLDDIENRLSLIEQTLSNDITNGSKTIVETLEELKEAVTNKKLTLQQLPANKKPEDEQVKQEKKSKKFKPEYIVEGLKVSAYLVIVIYGLMQMFS
jgi:biopolymer transport protein ExbB/TolQ